MSASIYNAIQTAVLAKLQGATWTAPGFGQGNIVLLEILTNLKFDIGATGTSYPCLAVAPFGNEQIDATKGTNGQDDIVYPVVIVMADANQQDQSRNADLYSAWQETARGLFHNKRLSGASTVYAGAVEALANPDVGAWMDNSLYVWGLVCKFKSRETRPST